MSLRAWRAAPQLQFNLRITARARHRPRIRWVYGRDARVVVTGGAGFIGSHLVESLLNDGTSQLTVIDNLTRGRRSNLASFEPDPRLQFIEGDIRDYETVRRVMRGADIVYHLAAQATVMGAA